MATYHIDPLKPLRGQVDDTMEGVDDQSKNTLPRGPCGIALAELLGAVVLLTNTAVLIVGVEDKLN